MDEQELSPDEINTFGALEREATPPKELEDDIIRQLKRKGLIKTKSTPMTAKWAAIAASLLIVFWGGIQVEKYQSREGIPDYSYMLVLFEDGSFEVENSENIAVEYAEWRDTISSTGVQIAGQELYNEATLVSSAQVMQVDDVNARRVTGYFLLEGSSLEEVTAIARSSPHIKYGGTIEVKELRFR